jgi:hypothetical protein
LPEEVRERKRERERERKRERERERERVAAAEDEDIKFHFIGSRSIACVKGYLDADVSHFTCFEIFTQFGEFNSIRTEWAA